MGREPMNADKASGEGTLDRGTEKRLIDRAQRGDGEALRSLIDLHKDRLFSFLWRIVRNHHDAEEICQDAFLKAFSSLDSFSSEYRFSTWLFTIGYRLCLNALRRKKALSGDVDFSVFASQESSADAMTAQSEEARRLKELIWKSVDRLSPPQRAAVILFYRHGESCQDIAQVMQLPVATVKSHLHRARLRLKELLEPVLADDSSRARILTELAG
jgi:RNA polymerase sigma-70 factor (ECF subfamily)